MTERYANLVETFRLMKELALKLRANRMRRGAVDFDFEESKVIVDENGKPVDIVKRERSIAEQIIEEFMLAANETVAEHFHWLKVPFIYRIHEDPDQEKLMNFLAFVANFGYTVKGGKRQQGASAGPADAAGGHPGDEGADGHQHDDAAFDEAGQIRRRKYRAFRTGGGVLHAFHVADPAVSGPGHPPGDPGGDRRRRGVE
ncbi:hypothetical protein HMSSN036_21080 [Paenibacillus macerans]|nr:hypothetical protein HMSSN036_21080 [Paenibacillus macerans]